MTEIPSQSNLRKAPAPELPPIHEQAWNLTKAVAAFVGDLGRLVSLEQYGARLQVCDTCEFRVERRCQKCGCRIDIKARVRVFKCQVEKWSV